MKEITFKEFVLKYKNPLWQEIPFEIEVENYCHEKGLVYEHLYFEDGFLRFDVYENGEILFSIYDKDPKRLMENSYKVLFYDKQDS